MTKHARQLAKARDRADRRLNCIDCHTPQLDTYMVRDDIWQQAGLSNGRVCLECLTCRIGRPLIPEDFTKAPCNFSPHIADYLIGMNLIAEDEWLRKNPNVDPDIDDVPWSCLPADAPEEDVRARRDRWECKKTELLTNLIGLDPELGMLIRDALIKMYQEDM